MTRRRNPPEAATPQRGTAEPTGTSPERRATRVRHRGLSTRSLDDPRVASEHSPRKATASSGASEPGERPALRPSSRLSSGWVVRALVASGPASPGSPGDEASRAIGGPSDHPRCDPRRSLSNISCHRRSSRCIYRSWSIFCSRPLHTRQDARTSAGERPSREAAACAAGDARVLPHRLRSGGARRTGCDVRPYGLEHL